MNTKQMNPRFWSGVGKRGMPVALAGVLSLVPLLRAGAVEPSLKPKDRPPGGPTAPQKGLQPPGYLNQTLYEILHKRMQRHGDSMSRLVSAVVLLNREDVVRHAERIATEPTLKKPQAGDMNDVDLQLPDRFYLLGEQLQERARSLTEAARGNDDAALASNFGRLTETCVSCHSAYRSGARTR